MNRRFAISGVAAVVCHLLLHFGVRPGANLAVPLPTAEHAVEVSLVAAAPAPALAVAESLPDQPPAAATLPDSTAIPEPLDPPETLPIPETVPKVVPEPIPVPLPNIAPTVPRCELPKPSRPAPASRSVATGSPAQTVRTEKGGTGGTAASGMTNGSAGSGTLTAKPRYRSNPKPQYPPEARRLRQQGRVQLTVEVSADGHATAVTLRQSSGFPLLDAAALQAVRRWSFEPARTAGLPVASRAEVPVQFNLAP